MTRLCPDPGLNPVMSNDSIQRRLAVLDCYLVFYWDHYLAHRNCGEFRDKPIFYIENSLRDVIQQITILVPQVPDALSLITQVSNSFHVEPNSSKYPDIVLPSGSTHEDIKTAFLFCWAKYVENIITTSAHSVSKAGAVRSSIALLRLCKMVFAIQPRSQAWSGFSMTQRLFWIGLCLTKHVATSGKYWAKVG